MRVSTCGGTATATRAARPARRGAIPARPFGSRASTWSRCRTSRWTRSSPSVRAAIAARSTRRPPTARLDAALVRLARPTRSVRRPCCRVAVGGGDSGVRRASRSRRLGGSSNSGRPRPGLATVVVPLDRVAVLVSREARRRVQHAIEQAGAAATDDAPVAWLRMEPGQDPTKSAEVRLTRWPDRREQVVARTGYHGRPVRSVPGPVDAARRWMRARPTSS